LYKYIILYYNYNANPNCSTKTLSCQYAGEYTTWTGGEVGVTYTVGSSNSTDWITIRRDTYDGPVEVVGTTPIYLTPTSANQTYHFHINTNDLCGIESVCRDAQMTRQSALTSYNALYGW
jgi:hypothetical protein